ncbi:MAG: hypothetical protein U0R70_10325 [Solirubrobacteraceae bacterium]
MEVHRLDQPAHVQRRGRVEDDSEAEFAGARRDPQLAPADHRVHVRVERLDVGRHVGVLQAEQAADEPVVLPERVALVAVQAADVAAVDAVGGVDERREGPQEVLRVVGGIRRAGRERAGRLGQLAADAGVDPADARGHLVGVGAPAEVDRVHDRRRPGEAPMRVGVAGVRS